MKFAWLTDIHLNFAQEHVWRQLFSVIRMSSPYAIMISGDIGEATSITAYLCEISAFSDCPVYFVLGNHDYYHGSLTKVRSEIDDLCRGSQNLTWLSNSGIIELAPGIGLLGHDSWADGRFGNYKCSDVELNDYFLVGDLANRSKTQRLKVMQQFAGEAADHMERLLEKISSHYRELIIITHVPPFRESCWHEGRISDDNWLPHFSSQIMGDVLWNFAEANPQTQMSVFCGHTHGSGTAIILPNLVVHTGEADYGRPKLQRMIEIG